MALILKAIKSTGRRRLRIFSKKQYAAISEVSPFIIVTLPFQLLISLLEKEFLTIQAALMMVPSWRLLKTILIRNPEMNLVMMQVTTVLMKVHIKHYYINAHYITAHTQIYVAHKALATCCETISSICMATEKMEQDRGRCYTYNRCT